MKSLDTHLQPFPEHIDSNLLLAWGAAFKKYNKSEYIFREGQHAHFYHQVSEGKVKMINVSEEGKEFIQGFFYSGESFGDPSLFDEEPYPTSALADTPTVILRLHVSTFLQLLKENFDVHLSITKLIALRLKNKSNKLKELTCYNPEERIISLLQKFKKEQFPNLPANNKAKIGFTRQEIADMSGLRVETVIRIMRHLHDRQLLTIEHGKVYY